MLPEDNTFKIVYRFPPFGRPTTRDAPRYSLEIINDIGGWCACQLPIQIAIGIGRGNVNSGSDQKRWQILNIGQRVKLGSTAQAGHRSSRQEERNIAAELGGEFHQFFKTNPFTH